MATSEASARVGTRLETTEALVATHAVAAHPLLQGAVLLQAREHLLLAEFAGAPVHLEPEAHRAGELVEESREGTAAGVGRLLEQALLGLGEEVGAVAPERTQEVGAAP